MPEYHRSLVKGGTFFFTVVTYRRQRILTVEESRKTLHMVWTNAMEEYPFTTDAVCLLPDHLHCIWTLPEGDSDYSSRWNAIKRLFTQSYIKMTGLDDKQNESHAKRNEAAVWQRRFWEHTIRDEADFHRHLDYIHFNPVKHNLVKNVSDWPWSSFHRYVKMGYYESHWGGSVGEDITSMGCGE
jgi:putative transposase